MTRRRARPIDRNGVVAARCAARPSRKTRGLVVHRCNDEVIRRSGGLIGQRTRLNPYRRAAAGARRKSEKRRQPPSVHGISPAPAPGWMLSAKRTFACARNDASDALTGRRELAANEYTPASVGPETILNPASSSTACSLDQGDRRGEHGAYDFIRYARLGGRDRAVKRARPRRRLHPAVGRQHADRHRHDGNRCGHHTLPGDGSPDGCLRSFHLCFGGRRSAQAVQPRLQSLERRRRHVFNTGLGAHARVDAPLQRHILPAPRASRQMRIHALPIALTDAAVHIPRNQHRDLIMRTRVAALPTDIHSLPAIPSAAPPLEAGRYWRSFSRA